MNQNIYTSIYLSIYIYLSISIYLSIYLFRGSPNICERMMEGVLGRHGIKDQRARMRESMTRVNPSIQLNCHVARSRLGTSF